jgi:filamentous hemagglutinin
MKLKQTLTIFLSVLLIDLPLYASSNIVTDGTTNTATDRARNDVTIVNIANPNSKGLSHNKYRHYNVNNDGVILNNSKDTQVDTVLSGYIYGNTHLNSNAKVILNEVTSTNRSYINGYTEVAG